MNQEPEILEKIDLYLNGKMSLRESAEFEQRIQADKELSNLTSNQKVSHEIVIGSRLHNLKAMMDHDFDSGKVNSHKGNWKWWITGLGMIAGIMVVAINYFDPAENVVLVKDQGLSKNTVNSSSKEKVSDKINIVNPKMKNQDKSRQMESTVSNVNKIPDASLSEILKSENGDNKVSVPVEESKMENIDVRKNDKNIESVIPSKEEVSEEKKKPLTDQNQGGIPPESVVKKINSYSFNPDFGEVFQIPVEAGMEAEIKIMNRAGSSVFSQKLYGDHHNTWDGRNFQGGISAPGLYIYILEYTNGQKESGQIIIY